MHIDKLVKKLTNCNENSLLVATIATTPQHDQAAPMPSANSTDFEEPVRSQNHSKRRQQRRAASSRTLKNDRTPEEKVSAAEALLHNICNQAKNMGKHKVPSLQRPARLAYKAARKLELENEAQMEETAIAAAFQGCGYSKKLTKEQIRKATINRTIPTAVVDSGASSTCVKPAEEQAQESVCGGYKWTGPSYQTTGKKSNKIFAMALGHTAPGGDVVDLPLPLREEAREGHTVKGIQKDLYSINRLVK